MKCEMWEIRDIFHCVYTPCNFYRSKVINGLFVSPNHIVGDYFATVFQTGILFVPQLILGRGLRWFDYLPLSFPRIVVIRQSLHPLLYQLLPAKSSTNIQQIQYKMLKNGPFWITHWFSKAVAQPVICFERGVVGSCKNHMGCLKTLAGFYCN